MHVEIKKIEIIQKYKIVENRTLKIQLRSLLDIDLFKGAIKKRLQYFNDIEIKPNEVQYINFRSYKEDLIFELELKNLFFDYKKFIFEFIDYINNIMIYEV